jgi:predicted amidohydrolase
MDKIKISTAQFENRSGNKEFNLSRIESLAQEAAFDGAHAIAFHECSVTGYSFARNLSREEMTDLAEFIPGGPSIKRLTGIASVNNIYILAGLFEKDTEGKLYKTYVCVDKNGLVASYRKLHPFINPCLTPGDKYCIFDLNGWKCGILICSITILLRMSGQLLFWELTSYLCLTLLCVHRQHVRGLVMSIQNYGITGKLTLHLSG